MSTKLEKFLAKLAGAQLANVIAIIDKIIANDLSQLDCKILKGKKGMYRVRAGRVRIIFFRTAPKNEILHISFRDDQTYQDL